MHGRRTQPAGSIARLTAATTLATGGRRSGRTQTRPGVGSNECQATILERS